MLTRDLTLALSVLSCLIACSDSSAEGGDVGDVGETAGDGDTGDGDGDGDSGDGDGDGDGDSGDGDGDSGPVPEFGETFTVVGTAADGLSAPRDLEFNPTALDQLWTFNTTIHGTVIYFDPGTPQQTSEVRVDTYAQHFMAFVSSAAFSDNGNFSSCQESRDEWNAPIGPQPPDNFMGPTLWTSNLDIYAVWGQEWPLGQYEGSHIDMLHQSPLCMGIAHEVDNVYWAYDGMSGDIVRYDFQMDHGPGGGDHSDGIIRRYMDASVTRVANVVGHMEFDHATGMLYVADTGADRIMRLDTASGSSTGSLPNNWDAAAEYTSWEGSDWQVFAQGLAVPAGLALYEDRVFVSENGSGDIVAFDMDGNELARMSTPAMSLMGITFGPDGKIWYADPVANEIVRVDE